MACKVKTVKKHKRCLCNGKWAKNARCKLKAAKKKKSSRRASTKKDCKAGTLKKYGKVCGCKTKGGGFKPVKAWRCK